MFSAPPPRQEEASVGGNEPRQPQAVQDEPNVSRDNRQLDPLDVRHRLNAIHAGKEDSYLSSVCFGLAVRSVQIPRDMTLVSKSCPRYNGAEKPNSWLSAYALVGEIAGGGGLVAPCFLPLMLEGTARSWIENLPEKSIHNWRDMEKVFTQHFQDTYKGPNTYTDLTSVCRSLKRRQPSSWQDGFRQRQAARMWTTTKQSMPSPAAC